MKLSELRQKFGMKEKGRISEILGYERALKVSMKFLDKMKKKDRSAYIYMFDKLAPDVERNTKDFYRCLCRKLIGMIDMFDYEVDDELIERARSTINFPFS